jgi:class 3 adenylate cyclase/tetratricopeptide (TPR) repeat protein
MFSKYIPQHFIESYNEISRNNYIRIKGYVIYAELSGFSAMSDKISVAEEGSDIVSSALNRIFEALINIIHKRGGSVYKLGGDSITVFFPDTVHSRTVNNCGIELLNEMKNHKIVKTDPGQFKIEFKCGASFGALLIGQLGKNEKEFFIAGKTLDRAVECANNADKGEFLVSCSLRFKLGLCGFQVKNESFFKAEMLEELFESISEGVKIRKIHSIDSFTRKVIIDKDNNSGYGEFRYGTILSVGFSGIEYDENFNYSALNDLMTEIFRITTRYGGFVNRVDLIGNENKILLLFGAPAASENNEEMSARCAFEILNSSKNGIKMKMAIYSGTSYFGTAGSSDRHEFIAVGNTLNLSIRLMKSATINEIIISETTVAKISGAVFENEREKGFKGIKQKYKIFSLKGFNDKADNKCSHREGRQKEIGDYEKIINDRIIKKIFISGEPGTGKSMLGREFSEISSKRGKVFFIECRKESAGIPYCAVKKLLILFLESISTNRNFALKKILSDIKEDHNYSLYADFAGLATQDKISDRSMSNVIDDLTVSLFSGFLNRYRSFVFIDDIHYIDSCSLNILNRILNNESTDCVFHLISENEERTSLLKTGTNEHVFHINILEIPQTKQNIREMILNRVEKLDHSSRKILEAASVLGNLFTLNNLKQIKEIKSKFNESELKEKLKILNEQCFIQFEVNKADEYLFKNSIIRDVVYSAISERSKKKYHEEAAEVYEHEITNEACNQLYITAFNYKLSGNREKAKEYLILSAYRSFAIFCYRSVLDILSELRTLELSEEETAELYLLEADICRIEGRNESGIVLCDRVKKMFTPGNIFFMKATGIKTDILFNSGKYSDSIKEAEQADKSSDKNIYVKMNCRKGLAQIESGQITDAEITAAETYGVQNVITVPEVKANIFELSGKLNLSKGKFKIARAYFEDMLKISHENCLAGEKLSALINISLCFEKENENKRSLEILDELCNESLKIHNFDYAISSISCYISNSATLGTKKKAVFYAGRWLNSAKKFSNNKYIEIISDFIKNNFPVK